jgi:cobalt-zinc-cadmium efflux system outer membrane protein
MVHMIRSTVLRVCTVAAIAAGGCAASLDPAPDIGRAAVAVEERSGWRPTWDQPWADAVEGWDGSGPLGLEQAVASALRNNRAIRAEIEQIAAGRADLVQAGLLPNPVLSLTVRFPFAGAEGVTFVGASVMEQFTSLWLRGPRIRAAEARLNETVLSVSDRALQLVADVKRSHAALVYGQRAVELTRRNIAIVEESVAALRRRMEAGEGTLLDVNRARQQLLNLQASLALEERRLAVGQRQLLELIGFAAAGDGWSAADSPAAHEPVLPEGLDEQTAVALARAQRLDVAASRAVFEARTAELSEQEQSRLNDLALGLSYERDTDGVDAIGPELEVAVPVFDLNQARIARAEALARAALATHEAVTHRAITEARRAFVGARTAADVAQFYRRDLLSLAEENLSLAEASLQAGESDVTVLLEAQREVVAARKSLNELEAQAAVARIELEYAVGGRLEAPRRPATATEPAADTQ